MPRLIYDTLRCPQCSTTYLIKWWDDVQARIFKVRCPKCHRCWDYRVLNVGSGNFTIAAIQN